MAVPRVDHALAVDAQEAARTNRATERLGEPRVRYVGPPAFVSGFRVRRG